MITPFSAYKSINCGEIKKPLKKELFYLVGSEELTHYAFASAKAALKAKQGKLKQPPAVFALSGIRGLKHFLIKRPSETESFYLVGSEELESPTSSTSMRRSSQLSYEPIEMNRSNYNAVPLLAQASIFFGYAV
jgi:hypothetical protein